jgi:cytosine/adenosine deaminase-related metal-dependent hydrolase
MILRARWVLDRRLRLVCGGRVRLPGGPRELDLGDAVLMPGLVNAHCHLDYTGLRGRLPRARGFSRWIEVIGQAKRGLGPREYRASILAGMREALACGTTAMANWICQPPALPARGAPPMRVWWLWEQIAYRPGPSPGREAWTAWAARVRQRCRLWRGGVAPHAPYTCLGETLRAAAAWSAGLRAPWSVHVAESDEEWRMFREGRGPLFEFMRRLGRPMGDCGGRTPLAAAWGAAGASRAAVVLVHANCLSRGDLSRLAEAAGRGKPVAVVHCPRSTARLGHPAFPLRALRSRGVRVALGTDSLASNDDLSMFAEMRALSEAHRDLDPREVVRMATSGAAAALGQEAAWPGWRDWIAVPCAASRPAGVWEGILGHEGPVAWAMVDGTVVRS